MEEKESCMTGGRAEALLDAGFYCSQCVFPYAACRLGMDEGHAYRMSAGLGGGCFHGDSCGAVTGAIMALGMVYGFDQPNSGEADERLIAKVYEFEDRFRAENGGLLCRELLGGFDKADRKASAPEGTYDNCPKYCATACRILDEMIGEQYIR